MPSASSPGWSPRFLDAYPADEAVTATADHLRQFWDPPMRSQLKELAASGGESDLTPTPSSPP